MKEGLCPNLCPYLLEYFFHSYYSLDDAPHICFCSDTFYSIFIVNQNVQWRNLKDHLFTESFHTSLCNYSKPLHPKFLICKMRRLEFMMSAGNSLFQELKILNPAQFLLCKRKFQAGRSEFTPSPTPPHSPRMSPGFSLAPLGSMVLILPTSTTP